jgi:hypothetical protein
VKAAGIILVAQRFQDPSAATEKNIVAYISG